MTDGGSRQATGLDDWLQRRFPGGGTLEERLRVRNTRRLPGLVAVLGGVYLASAAVTTRWHPAAGRPALPLVVVSVALSVAAVVAAAVCLVQIVRAQGREGPRDARLLPALSWAERGELLTELRGRRSVPPGDEEALAVLLRSRRNTVPFAWLGLAQLTGAVAQSMRSPGGYLGAVWLRQRRGRGAAGRARRARPTRRPGGRARRAGGRRVSDLEFADWLERRFPDERDLRTRLRDRWRWFLGAALPLAVLAAVAAGRLFDALADRLDAGGAAPVDGSPVLGALAWGLLAVGVLLVALGLLGQRPRAGEQPAGRRTALQALTARQRWELFAELRGRRPAPPEDVPVLRHLARGWVRDGRTAPAALGFALVSLSAGLRTGVGPVWGAAGTLVMAAAFAGVVRNARAGRAFLTSSSDG